MAGNTLVRSRSRRDHAGREVHRRPRARRAFALALAVVAAGACGGSQKTPDVVRLVPSLYDGTSTAAQLSAEILSARLVTFDNGARTANGTVDAERVDVKPEKLPCKGVCPNVATPVFSVRTQRALPPDVARVLTTPGYFSVRVVENDHASGCSVQASARGYDWKNPFPSVPGASSAGCYSLGNVIMSFVAPSAGFDAKTVLISTRLDVERQTLLNWAREHRTGRVAVVLDGWVLASYALPAIDGLDGGPALRPLGNFSFALASTEAAVAVVAVANRPPLPAHLEILS